MRFNEQHLEQALRSHDWFWKMADNDATYTNCKFERDHIHNMISEVGEEKGRALWNQWAPQVEKGAFPEHLF